MSLKLKDCHFEYYPFEDGGITSAKTLIVAQLSEKFLYIELESSNGEELKKRIRL